ncbi:similar to Saccharomyces cerevisiae YDL018C ERP3 Protein with similarity to Emp24p and Erv25p, member of the p24 family involved in ER to Golgi transport [Maudiozyma barnettii]|uniref:Similar to Saccharomyces cerevisiae YDL018C ERP3 Protein with similarity to Emp24p and Erv25p, member of the p24 family involved in ER to Golgi transport n=1 Tax=Maudiozyma barnettii TaxID=61262 RepID=A0A8H2VE29_9SACH|nr:Erp3p [Kazachstania barnettii]CAB4253186.1 similar to Saccharomyces cerevisiae YDL018C ERP3 Protein with similarity to Emp24p and Erv25p, member of the p24 family involved in ER to Golgi transport [Kazachstania barnettii]CAD1780278.1 similar to Saccharomyces cerevisiae YDL018C ERP3 Protein with similarity to Emp24p and Erv25p, member of the p24 family involved in ER to Golgi transport [Kazachstania barnettii]
MKLSSILLSTLSALSLSQTVASTPLTFELKKGQDECFYTLTSDIDCDITYYFSVQDAPKNDYEIGYKIYGPANHQQPIIERSNERQGEWEFLGDDKGEYKFCFEGGKHGDKIVDFEIKYDCKQNNDARSKNREERKKLRNLREVKTDAEDLQTTLDDSIDKIERQLHMLESNMNYYLTRNSRNHLTVKSTESRIGWFSMYGILLVVGMSAAQILVLQWFFKQSRKNSV